MKNPLNLNQLRSYNPAVLGAGLILVAAGIFAILILDSTNWWNLTLVILGVAVLGLFLYSNLAEVKAAGKKRSNLMRANLAFVAVAMFGIICGLNYVISRHPLRFDLTANKFYTLSDQTLGVLTKLDKDVNVTLFTSSRRSSAEVMRAQQLLEEYGKKSTKFRFRVVDGDKNPTEAKRLGVKEPNTVVFESGENRKDVLQRDYVTYPMSQGNRPTPKFQGEGAFTSALLKMTDKKHLTVYFIQGHGEKDINDPQGDGFNYFNDTLQKQNYTTKPLSLLTTGKIPEDADILAIIGPKKAFGSAEVELLRKYMQSGGKMVICVDPMTAISLDVLFKDYGIKLNNDIVVDPTSFYFTDVSMTIPQYIYHPIVEKLSTERIASVMPFCRSMQIVEPAQKGVTHGALLHTTDKGWGETNLSGKNLKYEAGTDNKGPVTMAIACEWTPADPAAAEVNPKGRLVVFGGSTFLVNQVVQQNGNQDLGLNSFNWATMQENKISIHPKEDDIRVVNLSNVGVNVVYYLCVIIMPLAVLALGGFIWYRRRSL